MVMLSRPYDHAAVMEVVSNPDESTWFVSQPESQLPPYA